MGPRSRRGSGVKDVHPRDVGPKGGLVEGVSGAGVPNKGRTLRADAWRRLRRNKLAMVALVWLIFVILVAATANLWAPSALGDPIFIDTTKVSELSLQGPSTDHLFGTDQFGRDVLCRVIYGAQVSLRIGVLAVAIMVAVGMIMGALAAYYGGVVDAIIMRLVDAVYSIPYILFALVLIAVLGKSWMNVFVAIGVIGWPGIARVFRSSILTVKENEYVQAARALGASSRRILTRHIMPNAMAPIVVYGTMSIGSAILAEAALSFLGMGVQLPNPSWGNMLEEARNYMTLAPWLMVFPGIAILTTVLAFVLLGDGLRDAVDVKMKE